MKYTITETVGEFTTTRTYEADNTFQITQLISATTEKEGISKQVVEKLTNSDV